jgi:hypothetical protein
MPANCVVLANSTAAPCHHCRRWIERDVHYAEQRLYCSACCVACRPAEPLPGGEAKPAGEQGGLFGP